MDHLRPPWTKAYENICKAMQDYGRNKNEGIALISVNVLVNSDGNPLFWSSPLVLKVEPKRLQREDLEAMTKEELLQLLIKVLTQ